MYAGTGYPSKHHPRTPPHPCTSPLLPIKLPRTPCPHPPNQPPHTSPLLPVKMRAPPAPMPPSLSNRPHYPRQTARPAPLPISHQTGQRRPPSAPPTPPQKHDALRLEFKGRSSRRTGCKTRPCSQTRSLRREIYSVAQTFRQMLYEENYVFSNVNSHFLSVGSFRILLHRQHHDTSFRYTVAQR